MSQIEQQALQTNFENWRKERVPNLPQDKAFERYCADLILKDYELSDIEISSGKCGGTDDGGVDGFYFFAGRRLITEFVDIPEGSSTATLAIIQATYETGGFKEIRMERFETFARDLLDYQTPPNKIAHLNADTRALISNFRTKYEKMLGTPHTLNVIFHYAMRTTSSPARNPKLASRFKRLERFVKSHLTSATVSWKPWGSSQLLARVREQPEQSIKLPITHHFTTTNGDVVCLARLTDFFAFLKGKDGDIRSGLLEPNVRDYQGIRNPVNQDIHDTLENPKPNQEFWWLNNGITVLAHECPIVGNTLILKSPEIVNGLQTSYEIFWFFRDNPQCLTTDGRCLILRAIKPPDEKTSGDITKATNFQTEVKGMSLRANEPIHFDIEDKFLQHGLFYDRKRGKYKRLKKPLANIVPVVDLARAVIATLLRRPDDARARPQSLLDDKDIYPTIFSRTVDCNVYLFCIVLDRRVSRYLEEHCERSTPEENRDIRYYLDMWLSCELSNAATPDASMLAGLISKAEVLSNADISKAAKMLLMAYRRMGGTEQVAKGPRLATNLRKRAAREFPRQPIVVP